MQNVCHPSVLTYVSYIANVLEILDDKFDMNLMILLVFFVVLKQVGVIPIEPVLFKCKRKNKDSISQCIE